jgi:hypothetical protein
MQTATQKINCLKQVPNCTDLHSDNRDNRSIVVLISLLFPHPCPSSWRNV